MRGNDDRAMDWRRGERGLAARDETVDRRDQRRPEPPTARVRPLESPPEMTLLCW